MTGSKESIHSVATPKKAASSIGARMPRVTRSLSENLGKVFSSFKRDSEEKETGATAAVAEDFSGSTDQELSVVKGQLVELIETAQPIDERYIGEQWCLVRLLRQADGSLLVPGCQQQQGFVPAAALSHSLLSTSEQSSGNGGGSTEQQPRIINVVKTKVFAAGRWKMFSGKGSSKRGCGKYDQRSASMSMFYRDRSCLPDNPAESQSAVSPPPTPTAGEPTPLMPTAQPAAPADAAPTNDPGFQQLARCCSEQQPDASRVPERQRSLSLGPLTLEPGLAAATCTDSSLSTVPDESQPPGLTDTSHSENELALVSEVDLENWRRKRSFVLQELLDTEKVYVADLGLCVEGYMEEIKQMPTLPDTMQGKDKIVFGNIHQIYDFHKDIFQPEIKKCLEDPHRLGTVFQRYERRLYMYVKYCENKPKSECIVAENDSFFDEIRRKLGHKLTLPDLLIKPIQRIMKYQLLLKEVHKFSKRCMEDCTALDAAIDVMHVVPKAANDMMNVGRLQGFNGSITAQGKLLHQDKLLVTELSAKSDQKPHERHVFVFEQIIIFSEATEKKNSLTAPFYIFKNALKVNKMSLEECGGGINGDALRFVLVDRTPGSDLRLVLQPCDIEARTIWLGHINSMLAMQGNFLRALQSPIAFQKEITCGLTFQQAGWTAGAGAGRKGSSS